MKFNSIQYYSSVFLTFFLWLTGIHIICAQDATYIEYSILPGSTVSVTGSTNVNEFSCYSGESFTDNSLQVSVNSSSQLMISGAVLNLRTESLNCGNEVMNDNLFKTLHSDKFEFIVIDLRELYFSNNKLVDLNVSNEIVASVYITIAGQRKPCKINFQLTKSGSDSYKIKGKHKISLKDYGIEPPIAFFGLIKVRDDITVKFDLIAEIKKSIQ